MTPADNPFSILQDGKLKPGIYKIQSLYNEAYLDIEDRSREAFCRPGRDLSEGRGLVRHYSPPPARRV